MKFNQHPIVTESMRRYILVILWVISALVTQAQFVFVPGQVYDFGNVDSWKNDPAVFNLVNTGSKPLAILKLTGQKDIVAEYPRTYIQPGDTGKIILRYYTPNIGPFSESIEISLTSSFEPVKLTLKGKIKTIASDALTACPNDQMQGTTPNFSQQFIVIDSKTNKVIPSAHFFVGTQGQMVDEFKTPGNGRAANKTYRSGMYIFQISAEDYSSIDTGAVILAGQRTFTFYLNKTVVEPEPQIVQTIPTPAPIPVVVTPPPVPVANIPVPATTTVDTLAENTVLPLSKYKPNNIVFVLDVSASMRIQNRIEMLKESMLTLAQVLRKTDRISIITFTNKPVTRIQGAAGNEKDTINKIINSMVAAGSTNGIKGLQFAYELAERNFIAGGNNIVIIGTDGIFNMVDENGVSVEILVQNELAKNIKLGVMSFGKDETAIKTMQQIAVTGAGGFMRMDDPNKASQLLLEQIQIQSAR